MTQPMMNMHGPSLRRRHVVVLLISFVCVFNSMKSIRLATTTAVQTTPDALTTTTSALEAKVDIPSINTPREHSQPLPVPRNLSIDALKAEVKKSPATTSEHIQRPVTTTSTLNSTAHPQTLFPPNMFWTIKKFSELKPEERDLCVCPGWLA